MSEAEERSPAGLYYDEAWRVKLVRPEYSTIERRWRSRWDFVADRIERGARVVDIGCGDGVLGERLVHGHACEVVGCDVSAYALRIASDRGVDGRVLDIDHQPLPFADDSFDAGIASCVLEHIAHPEHAIRELARVVRPGGHVYVSLPNPLTWKIRLAFLRGEFHHDFLHSQPGEGLHYRFWTVKDGFERMIAELELPLRVIEKRYEIKNTKALTGWRGTVKENATRMWPGMFAEYVHFDLG